jgi:hypothetical protein
LALAPLVACGPDDTSSACKDTLLAGDLVVTEVMADYAAPNGGTGTDDGKEWFEIYNNADRPVSLKGVTVVHSRPDGSKSATHTIDDITLAPGQFFTLGNATQDLVPAYVDYGYGADLGDFFNTDGGKLALKCGDSVIDEAVYDSVKSGHSREFSNSGPPDYTLNDDQVNWCEANDSEFEPNNFGTPGQDNDCSPIVMGACSDGGTMRPVVSPAPGELVITEVMASPNGTDSDAEWFEAKALASFDLNGLGVGRVSDTTPDIIGTTDCIPVTSGTNIVFAHKTDPVMNGGLPPAQTLATFATSLVPGSTTAPGDIQLTLGGTLLDVITWTKTTTAKSLQLDPDVTNASANDDSSNFCDATTTYGAGGMGTPGMANAQCASQPPSGMCDMGGGSFRNIVKPAIGDLVISELMPNPATEPGQEWFEITNVGGASFDLNGLGLDRDDDTPGPVVIVSTLCKPVAASGGTALFARSGDMTTNGGLTGATAPDATFGFTMINTSGSVQVVDPTSCTGSPSVCTTIYDKAVWGATVDKKSLQLPPAMLNTTANDTSTNYCPGVTVYGTAANGNLGTPKATNSCT